MRQLIIRATRKVSFLGGGKGGGGGGGGSKIKNLIKHLISSLKTLKSLSEWITLQNSVCFKQEFVSTLDFNKDFSAVIMK